LCPVWVFCLLMTFVDALCKRGVGWIRHGAVRHQCAQCGFRTCRALPANPSAAPPRSLLIFNASELVSLWTKSYYSARCLYFLPPTRTPSPRSVLIFEATEPGFPADQAVRIFVQFERVEEATKVTGTSPGPPLAPAPGRLAISAACGLIIAHPFLHACFSFATTLHSTPTHPFAGAGRPAGPLLRWAGGGGRLL